MLLNKPFSQGDVVTFKLVGGEELITRYQGETPTEYLVTKPATLTATPNGSIGMMPSVFSADLNSTIHLQKSAVAIIIPTKKEFVDEYTKATSSIKPASSLEGLINAQGGSTGG